MVRFSGLLGCSYHLQLAMGERERRQSAHIQGVLLQTIEEQPPTLGLDLQKTERRLLASEGRKVDREERRKLGWRDTPRPAETHRHTHRSGERREMKGEDEGSRFEEKNQRGGKETSAEAHEGSSPCMAASSTYRLPLTGCTIAIASTFFAPPPTCLSSTRILHLQGGVTLKTLPVLNYSVPLSFSLSTSSRSTFSLRFFFVSSSGKLLHLHHDSLLLTSHPAGVFVSILHPSFRSLFLPFFSSSFSVCFEAFRVFCSLELGEPQRASLLAVLNG